MIRNLTLLLLATLILSSHDMFLKLDSFFLNPNEQSTLLLYNGSFTQSENSITRDRMLDVSIVSPSGREKQADDQWADRDNATLLSFKTGASGTYVAGVSTKGRIIDMEADAFNSYLQHDGVLDVLKDRKSQNKLDQDASELYSKHVKAVFQVGESLSSEYSTVLGYPIEFVPQANPYSLKPGDKIPILLLSGSEPLADQLVYLGTSTQHSHDGEGEHSHDHETSLRTNKKGVVNCKIPDAGHWYIRTIHMVETSGSDHNYESNWATLTFEVQ